jgi:glycosyltransferase involved in cell wall biosynthesis
MTLVSVVIPCFNAGAYVHEAVASARAQTWSSIEVIVVDDGSDDDETRAALEAIDRDGTARVLRITHSGPSVARNAGIACAAGPYIFALDSDDRIAPTLIERAVRIMAADDAVGLVYSQAQFFGTMTGVWNLPAYRFPDILLGNLIPSAAGLFRRGDWAVTGGYNPNMVDGWEDYDFWLSIIERGREVVQIPEPLVYYRRTNHSRGQGRSRETIVRGYAQLLRNHQRLFVDHIEVVIEHILDLRLRTNAEDVEHRFLERQDTNQ